MKKIFVVAPGSNVTGGPEVLHQLAHCLNQNVRRAWMLYWPLNDVHEIPDAFRRYNVRAARLQDVEPGSIVIMPEVCATLIRRFPKAEIFFWWLSVDNFFVQARYTPMGRLGAPLLSRVQLRKLPRQVAGHLYQSEYARQFLASRSLTPALHLGDYLAEEYVQAAAMPRQSSRENILVYNPSKGRKRTDLILRALSNSNDPTPQIVPIERMSRQEICALLRRAKVYIDFGGHPGKDRIPREAVALGACIIVNRRGSAANPVDIPIPPEFKIDDRWPGFEQLAVNMIHMLMDEYEQHAPRFDDYRQSIALEPQRFLDDACGLYPENA